MQGLILSLHHDETNGRRFAPSRDFDPPSAGLIQTMPVRSYACDTLSMALNKGFAMAARNETLVARVDVALAERVKTRAESRGMIISEYIRSLIIADINESTPSATMSKLTTEHAIVSALFLRRMLSDVIGEEKAQRMEEAATARAREIIVEHMQQVP